MVKTIFMIVWLYLSSQLDTSYNEVLNHNIDYSELQIH